MCCTSLGKLVQQFLHGRPADRVLSVISGFAASRSVTLQGHPFAPSVLEGVSISPRPPDRFTVSRGPFPHLRG